MKTAARIVIALSLFWGWQASEAVAQEDLIAKAQNERELVLYGTALAGQFDKFAEPFKRRYPFLNNYTHRIFMKKSIITSYRQVG